MKNKFIIPRQNRALRVIYSGSKFHFEIIKYSHKLSPLGTPEIEMRIEAIEDDPDRLWDIIDGLLYPDVLHPVHKDLFISPFGEDSKNWIKIRWEGWNEEDVKQRSLLSPGKYPELIEIMSILKTLRERTKKLENLGENLLRKTDISLDRLESFYRQTAHLLVDLFSELFPVSPWTMRGFLPLPFRRFALGRFRDRKSLSIRLSPQESRRFARFLKNFL